MKQIPGLPFLMNDAGTRFVGIKNPDGTDAYFPLVQANPKIVALGDSITGYNITATASEQSYSAFGFLAWAQVLMQGKIAFSLADNLGVSGDRIDQALDRLGSVFALNPGYCVVLVGTNDLAQSVPVQTMCEKMSALVTRLIENNITPVLLTVTPRTGLTATQRANHMQFNAWLRATFALNPNVILVDPFRFLADPTNANSDPASGMTTDGVHPTQTMAYIIGREISNALDVVLPRRPRFWAGNADTYDATNNPRGNFLVNSGFTATTTPGTGLTGTTGTSWTSTRTSGTGSATIAVQDRTDGVPGKEIILTINVTGQTSTEEWKIRQSVAAGASTYATGDVMFGACEIDVSASVNLKWMFLYLDDNNGVSVVNTARALSSASNAMPASAWAGALKTPAIPVATYGGTGTQALTLGLTVAVDGSSAGSVTIKFRAPQMLRVR